jgi:hypothetical protein
MRRSASRKHANAGLRTFSLPDADAETLRSQSLPAMRTFGNDLSQIRSIRRDDQVLFSVGCRKSSGSAAPKKDLFNSQIALT